MADLNGRTIGGFRIVREIRGGSQGTVYQAVCESATFAGCPPGTSVALKTMPVQDETHEVFKRLERRTRELAALRSRNIVRYFGCFHVQEPFAELHVIVMEYLEGETLKERLLRQIGGLDADEAMKVTVAMVSALAVASEKGICHRDIKPANIFLCNEGTVKLIDFEVARLDGATQSSGSGQMIGSFDYMAPDFTNPGFRGDVCSDVFSVGVVMHEAITGKTPYRRLETDGGQADFVFMTRWARNADGSFQNPAIVLSSKVKRLLAHTEEVLARALAPERKDRFPDFRAFAEGLCAVRFRDLRNGAQVYRILQLVGKGGFGEVFKARIKDTGRLVAVKHLLKSDYATRFHREAKIMAQFSDPCFVSFVDFFVIEHAGNREAFLVMDYLDGMPGNALKDAIRSAGGGLPRKDVLAAFARYAHGLRVLHARGIYHRDIKPANLYYPKGRVDRCAIMDFGIARDVNGTATTGGIPGTFDYMPPEVVTQQTRGEAGMDIYALGLCLFEALTGKTAYPRLPSGNAAYAKFFQRARTLAKPALNEPPVKGDAELMSLVREMTEPDITLRIVDTAQVERRLWKLAGVPSPFEDDAAATMDPTTVSGFSDVASDPEPPDADHTQRTIALRPEDVAKLEAESKRIREKRAYEAKNAVSARPARRSWLRVAMLLVTLALVGESAYMAREQLKGCVDWCRTYVENFQKSRAERAAAEVAQEVARKVALAETAAAEVSGRYGAEGWGVEECDAAHEKWRTDWASAIPAGDFARIEETLVSNRTARIERDRVRAEEAATDARMAKDAELVLAAYVNDGVADGDRYRAEWTKTWGRRPKDKLADQNERFDAAKEKRIRADREAAAFKAAEREAIPVGKSYLVDTIEVADKKRGIWESEWRSRLTEEHLGVINAKLDAIRKKAKDRQDEIDRQKNEKRLVGDCRALCDSLEPVESRRNRLDDAEQMLSEGVAAGIVAKGTAEALRSEIRDRRDWTVFRVSNRTGREIAVGSERIGNGKQQIFVFTNAVPLSIAVTCKGFDPLGLTHEDDGRTIRVSRESLSAQGVAVTVPKLPAGVSCQIDGQTVKSGTLKLMPGFHECIYRKADSKDQSVPFTIDFGVPMTLAAPGPWQISEEAQLRNREAARQEVAKTLAESCRALLKIEPIATRRARLAECESKLRQWKSAEVLGEELISNLREEWRVASARVIGVVSNLTAKTLAVGGVSEKMEVAPGSALRLDFPNGMPFNASLQTPGFDPVEFPAEFDGAVFVVKPEQMVPSPVRVTVPELESGVSCLIDGEPTVGIRELRPGRHSCVYRKGDCADIRSEFLVEPAKPFTLAVPKEWQESSGFASLKSAMAAMNEGAMDKVAKFLESAEVQSDENVRRKRELQRQMVLRQRFIALKDEAKAYFEDEMWLDAVRIYAELKKQGYVFSEAELKTVTTAYEKGRELCKAKRKMAQDSGTAADVEKADTDLRRIHVSYGIITGKTAD